jgi:hypothetical protein
MNSRCEEGLSLSITPSVGCVACFGKRNVGQIKSWEKQISVISEQLDVYTSIEWLQRQ